MLGKNGIFRGKSFEKSFFQEIPRNFPRKVIFRGKKCTKNRPQINVCVQILEIGLLGEQIFTFGQFLENNRNSPCYSLTFFHS
jgi:hypothetical protein